MHQRGGDSSIAIILKKASKIEKKIFYEYDSKNTIIQNILQNTDGSSPITIKKHTIGPSGRIATHSNPCGQAMYVISGNATIFEKKSRRELHAISPDMIVYVPHDVFYEIVNPSLFTPFIFLNIMITNLTEV